MKFDVVRMKVSAARSKIVSVVITTLISGLLVSIPIPANAAACNPTSDETNDGVTILTFATVGSCDWTVPSGITQAQVLIVAGGGGGGDSKIYATGGGGGAGGYFQSDVGISGSIAISVGAGGTGGANNTAATSTSRGTAGGDSSFGTLKVGGGGGGNSWNYTLHSAALAGNGGATYLTGGNGGGARSRPVTTPATATQTGGSGGGYSSTGIVFLGATFTGTAGVAGNNSNSSDAGTGGKGGSVTAANRTSTISGSSYEYSKPGEFKWPAGAQTYGSGGDAGYLGATDGVGGGAGSQGVVIVKYSIPVITVTYDVTGGSAPEPPSQTQSTSGQSLTLATYSGLKGTKRFMNWNTAANGTGTNYKAGTAYTPRTNLTLYAIWMDAYCPEGWTWSEPTCTKSYSGQNNFIVPWGFNSLDVIAIGGSGANGAKGAGGAGGKIQASYSFTQGDEILFFPGGVGSGTNGGSDSYPNENYNGGNGLTNNGGSGGGGAATVVTENGTSTNSIIIVAGGGGGGGANSGCGSSYNTESAAGQTTVSSNGFTYGSIGVSYGYNRYSGGGGGGSNGGKDGGATAAYSCSSGNDNGGHGRGGFRGGNTAAGASNVVSNAANTVNGIAGSVTLQLTRPVINYNLNGATGTAPAKQVQSSEGEDLVVAAVGVTRTGYTFGGWYTAANATGTLYTPGALYNTNAVITLYAKWTSTITFSGNSSTGGSAPATITVLGANTTVLPTNTGTLARTNFIFDGWNTTANGAGTHYATGATYTTTGDVTLYARWNSTITYNGNGNTGGTAPTATTAKGTAANTTLATPGTLVKSGATFAGWNTLQDGTGTTYATGLTTYAASGSITLYAKWIVAAAAPTLATSSDLGSSNSDKLTSDNTPDISVTGLVSGASVEVTATPASGSAITCTFTASSTSGTCTFSTLPDGTYSFTAKQTYNGGTSTASTALTGVVIDTQRPTVVLTSTVASGANDLIALNTAITNYTVTVRFSESVSGFLISEITKDAASTGWSVGTTLSGSGASYTFTTTNSGVLVNDPGKLMLRIAEGVATDAAGNTNTATTSDFVLNSVARVDFWDCGPIGQYCTGGTGPVSLTQASLGASITLPGPNTLYRTGYSFAGWGETINSSTVLTGSYTPTTRIKLIPQWTPSVYVVTYDANGGNGAPATSSQSFTYDGTALSPSARGTLARTGYTFGGWSTTAVASGTIYSNSTDSIASTTTTYRPTASITLYAKWTAGTYTVSFNGNSSTGGSTASMSITAGTAKALTTNGFTRTGYTFAGWTTAADGTGTSYANLASVTLYGDTTIYAKWVVANPGAPSVASASAGNTTVAVTVTGVSASGTTTSNVATGVVGPTSSYTIEAFIGLTATGKTCTVQTGTSPLACTISGLTNGTAYGFKVTATNTTGSATGSMSASTYSPTPYVVTYAANGGTLTPTATTANYNFGTPVTLPLATKAGYTFTGWNSPSVGLNGASYSPTASITLTAQWSAITYSVTYSGNGSNGGTVPSTGSYTYGSSYSISEDGNMTKSGYNFAGWATTSDGTGTVYANANDSIASSTATYAGPGNLTLYAKWTAQVYAITYDVNGATGAASKSSDSFTFGGTALVLPTIGTMAKTNYTFGGWSETSSGVAVTSPYSPTQTRTLYAVWSGLQYSISYNSNGGLGTVNDVLYTTGATGVTLNDGSGLSRTGYTFSGWKTSAGASVSTPYVATSNITLNAVWTAKTVTITYAKGIATTTTNFPAGSNATYGANFALSTTVDTSTAVGADNYAFAGWYETTTATTYKPGDNFRISTEANLTFTAQWIRLYEVTYNANGGVFAGSDGINDSECPSKLCATGQTITLHSAPSRTGFTFSGWVEQSGNVVTDVNAAAEAPGIQTTIIDTRYIFYATWTANSYTITFAQGAGSDGGASPITGTHGEIVTLALTGTYSLTGSVFTGWLIGSTTYPAGALYTLGTNATPITATAQYANNTFKIFYNSNGGTSTPNPTSAISGASITLDPATSFTKDGYDFDGWSDGTQKLAASFATTMGSANSTLIAQWRIKLPSAPTFSSVTGVDGGANIVVAPGSGGGSPTSYTVTSSPSGGSCTIYAPATSCSVSPLNNGTSYTFTVSATNSTGTTNGATSSPVTPAGKPGPPTGVSAVRGNGQATVTFTAPTDTGGSAITSYTVTAYDSSGNAAGTCTGSGTTHTCTGLTNGAAYTFKATATNALFTSDLSTASSAATPATVPNTPTSVAAAVTTAGEATVSFTAPLVNGGAAITGFTVTSSPGGFTCTAAADASSCVVSGLTNGTAYTFSVIATNEIGNSVASTASSAATPQSKASAPTTITATAGDGQASIAFSGAVTNGSTIANYTVQAYDGEGNVVEGATCTSSTSPCTITGLTNGSTYTFKVVTNSTVYGAGSTTASSQSSASNAVVPAKVPDAPSSVEVTPGTGKVTVSWDAPSSNGSAILSYSVQAYNSSGEAVTGATCTATTLTCDISSNLVAGSNYTFKVTATNAVGTSPASSASSSAAINAAPSAPLNVTAVASNASATASWDAPANINGSEVTGYTATAYDSNNNAQGTCTTNASTLTCDVTGLTNGSPYTFKVSATNGIGTSAASSASSAVTPSTVPNPPTNITVAASDAAVAVSFLAPSNTGGSAILRYEVTSSPGELICTVNAPTRSCTIAGLTNGTAYTFTVKAINANGSSVASSASSSVTPVASSAPIIASLSNQPTGNPYVGSTLTSNMSFNGSPIPTVTYQWKVCDSATDITSCTNLAGATSSTYIPTISELEKFIVVTATATNGIAPDATETSVPTQVINPEIIFTGPSGAQSGTVGTALVISLSGAGGVGTFAYTISSGTLPSGLTLDPATGQIAGTPTTAGTYTFTVRVTDSNGVYKEVVITITVAAATTPSSSGGGTPAPSVDPTPQPIACDSSCQAAKDAAATKAAADKAAADAIAKSAADKAVADAAAAAKTQSDTAATTASTKAAADAAAAATAAKAAIDKAAAAAVAQVAADAAAKAAAAQAKAASDAQAAAAKAAAAAASALKNSSASAAAKAAATASAQKAAAAAAAAVKAAATAAQQAATAKNSAANANKQVEIAINSLTSKTAASQASAQANAVAAAAKAAANEAAAAAATKAAEAKAVATAAQKAATETAARIATEQKQAADSAARAKIAAEVAAKATAEKVSAIAAATKATEDLAKVLADKAVLAEQAAKATDQTARAEIQKKIEEVSTKVEEVQKTVESATTKADEAVAAQATAVEAADTATKDAETQAAEAVAVKTESVIKTAEATKAVATATVATKVAAAANAAAAKVPSKAVITTKPSSSTSKNGAKATVTGLKPGQKVKVTVNVKPKP